MDCNKGPNGHDNDGLGMIAVNQRRSKEPAWIPSPGINRRIIFQRAMIGNYSVRQNAVFYEIQNV